MAATEEVKRGAELAREGKVLLERSDCTYTHCYCEENVYMLCKQLMKCGVARSDASDLLVVFISNPSRKIPLWKQRGAPPNECVVWDYHVICIQVGSIGEDRVRVWDLDTVLPFPVLFQRYVQEAFWGGVPHQLLLGDEYQRLYRVVNVDQFLRFFASNRSHMLSPGNANWLQPPPAYACITAEDGDVNNLEEYVRMSPAMVEEVPEEKSLLEAVEGRMRGLLLDEQGLLNKLL